MLVDYLERAALEVEEMKQKMRTLHADYVQTMDRTLRDEITAIKRDGKAKGKEIREQIFQSLQEFRLMKKHFPDLYQTFLEDEDIGKAVVEMDWLADFEELKKEDAERKLKKIKDQRKELAEGVRYIKEMNEPIEERKLVATWSVFDGKIKDGMDKEDALLKAGEIGKILNRKGWLIMLNEPMIIEKINGMLERFKKAALDEQEKMDVLEKVKGSGIYAEHKAKQEYDAAVKKRKGIERRCSHLLMANPKFFSNFRKQKMFWRERNIGSLMQKLLERTVVHEVKEKDWLAEMKKRIGQA